MQQSQVAQPWTTIASGSPLIRVEYASRVIDSRTHKTVILDDITFTISAHTLFSPYPMWRVSNVLRQT